ncbi:carboxymuconolactone decarboxylase family protein [Clostridium sp.]|jgi:4-carboxymuconolactone decarboxylase|uniref:carboxymuconolactone decarboxylase family protein n=1 Tax=Clostridium sp. TaxID=1506 RepID=UPI002583FC4B|nr:carboxymuconolactone decarboxylase family protein [Clostridium sp.]MDF2503268.1 carboxymuconolactone decarboxylase [Clostridium sp.]
MEDRLKRGYIKLREVDGSAGKDVENSLNDIFPDLVKYMIEYVWGDIYSRNILDLKSKEMAVVAALTAMGNAEPQLKVHINGALNVSCTINEIKEIILQMSAYSGFPACINAMNALKNVLKERENQGIKDCIGDEPTNKISPMERYEVGVKELSELDSKQVNFLEETYNDFSPDLVKFIVCGQADITARNNLNKRYRELSTISALAALGTAQPQLKFHINAGLNIGLTADEIKEIMLLTTVYSGFPKAINGTNILKEVLKERNE